MTILSLKNEYLEQNIAARPLGYWDFSERERGIMRDVDITAIIDGGTFWYLTNKLILTLRPSPEEVQFNTFKTDIGDYPNSFKTYWRLREPTSPVREWDYWRLFNEGGSVERIRYTQVSPTRIDIDISSDTVRALRTRINDLEFGILVLPIKFRSPEGNEFTNFYGIKISPDEVYSVPNLPVGEGPNIIEEPEPEYQTPTYSFESLFIPTLSCSLVYNFYEFQEENFDIINDRDYGSYSLRDIPKYIELSWNKSPNYIETLFPPVEGTEIPPLSTGSGETGFVQNQAPQPYRTNSEEPSPGAASRDGFIFSFPQENTSEGASSQGTRTAQDSERVYGGVTGGISETDQQAAMERLESSGFTSAEEPEPQEGTATRRFEQPESSSPTGIGGRISAGEDPIVTQNGQQPEFQAPVLKSAYVGYTIQKERYDEITQQFVPIDIIIINGRDTTKWIDWKVAYREVYRYKIRSVFRFVNKNMLSMYRDSDSLIDNREEFTTFESGVTDVPVYYYDSKFSKDCEIEVIERRSPDPPYNIKIIPNSKDKHIFISWNQKNQNRDVVGFNVYRKKKEGKFFLKTNSKLIDIRSNFWIDSSIEKDTRYIYAIEAVDIHDNFSKLSAQFSAQIAQQKIDILERCEDEILFEEFSGKTLRVSNNRIQQRRLDHLMFFDRKFKIKINPLFKNLERDDPFFLKIKSLDTNIEKDLEIKFTINTIYHKPGDLLGRNAQLQTENILQGNANIQNNTSQTPNNLQYSGRAIGGGLPGGFNGSGL